MDNRLAKSDKGDGSLCLKFKKPGRKALSGLFYKFVKTREYPTEMESELLHPVEGGDFLPDFRLKGIQ